MSGDASLKAPEQAVRVTVAGIGASAGGIPALQAFFSSLPPHVGAAIVVILHLDPTHPSELAAIIRTQTSMQVLQVDKPQRLERDTVYVIPPNRRLLVDNDSIETAEFEEPRGQRFPIDQFFTSLGERHGDGFAIVLSGSGADGSLGLRVVRENGGLVLVQAPEEAQFRSMPCSAIESGADFVLPVKDLARKFVELIGTKASVNARALESSSEEQIRRILGTVHTRTGQDFSGYKRATVLRRLARRMQVVHAETLESYLEVMSRNAEEAHALFSDLLISVTSFFRDPAAYEALALTVLPALFDVDPESGPIRVWVAGCATGEEAYSLAIVILEEAARREVRPEVQIFATDLDAQALAIAREGRYPSSIAANVTEERLTRFFVYENGHYRVKRELRDVVVFAVHSILRDPPFSRINLVSCRNLLIYMDREPQRLVATIFHYALIRGGYLFLGSSENADEPPGLFRVLNRDARIYQSVEHVREALPLLPATPRSARLPEVPLRLARPLTGLDGTVHRQVLEDIAPPSLLVDEGRSIVNLSETVGRFLQHPGGPLTSDATEVIRPELRVELTAVLDRVFEQALPTTSLPVPLRLDGSVKMVTMHARLVQRKDTPRMALVIMLEAASVEGVPIAESSDRSAPEVVSQLRDELLATRSLLRTTREKFETVNEELRAANEELQSINEEYRSTAEELETSKEELQTLNQELKLKLDIVSRAHSDLQNLISATDVGTMFLDTSLRIQRFTPKIADVFNIVPGDEGRPVTDFTHRLDYQDLIADARRVLGDLVPVERILRTTEGRWVLLRIRPYRTMEDKIDGIVATFVDITERREAENAWDQRQALLLNELSHRVKNTLAVVQAVTRQTLRGSVPKDKLDVLESRLSALGSSHDLLVQSEWRGASLEALIRQQLAPYLDQGSTRIDMRGPSVILSPALATPMGLVLHELATNAVKYGSLSVSSGRVSISWQTRDSEEGRYLELVWTEQGGPPPPAGNQTGAGSVLIDHALPKGHVVRDFGETGLTCSLSVPLV